MSDQSGFHDLSIKEDKKWLMPCYSWEAQRLEKLSPVKLLVFMAKQKRKNSWLTENKQEFEIMTTDTQHLTQNSE